MPALPLEIAKPTLIQPGSDLFAKVCSDDTWVVEEKLDGWRCLAHRNGLVLLYSKSGKLIRKDLDNIRYYLNMLPVGTCLDGELFCTHGKEEFHVFDIPMIAGRYNTERPLGRRRMLLYDIVGPIEGKHVRVVPQVSLEKEGFYNNVIESGAEGVVFKDISSPYPHGETMTWLKCKSI